MPVEALCSQTEAYWFYFGWSRVYERMQKFFTSNEMREAGLDLAEIHEPDLRVLDVGAGTGTLSMQVLERVEAQNLTLIDQSPHMLQQAQAKPALAKASDELLRAAANGVVESLDLVDHERDERRDDDDRLARAQRRQLVAHGFSAAGRPEDGHVAAGQCRLDDLALAVAKVLEAKVLEERVGERRRLHVFVVRARDRRAVCGRIFWREDAAGRCCR